MTQHRNKWLSWFRNAPNLGAAKRVIVIVVGGTITLIGVVLLVLPGPAFIVIPIGLSILATEFVWARRLLKKARELAANVVSGKSSKDKS